LSSQTDINLTSHHGNITQSGDIKAVQNIDINANQTYQNEGKDTIAQANLAITFTPAPFSVTMSLMLPAEILDRCEISMPNSIGAALVFDLTSPVV
jgi:hypothetical protein